jgi:hypothetical protein
VGFAALYGVGVYLGDLVGIGGYAGWASEELYRWYQYGDVAPWLYKLTEWAAFASLGIGAAGVVVLLLAAVIFAVNGAFNARRRAS